MIGEVVQWWSTGVGDGSGVICGDACVVFFFFLFVSFSLWWKLVLGDAKWWCRSEVDRVTNYVSDKQIFVLFSPSKGPFCNKFLFTFLGS
jgi:hypothetical protein